ncbi:hypothetical protein [Sphingobium phenoxybenzoativorans]|uniref:hypothetical protein n=1 Tax=Sphingobium phenoxybenzoativorans TaxID=1592790 RepID=UPI00087246D6|nr:hypothetical protein [Sphingobium phenoxybenzoativorans]
MNSFVAGPAGLSPVAVTRNRHLAAQDPAPFISWLRQTRRSAWLAIGLCLLFRAGDALIHDGSLAPGSPALAAGVAR